MKWRYSGKRGNGKLEADDGVSYQGRFWIQTHQKNSIPRRDFAPENGSEVGAVAFRRSLTNCDMERNGRHHPSADNSIKKKTQSSSVR